MINHELRFFTFLRSIFLLFISQMRKIVTRAITDSTSYLAPLPSKTENDSFRYHVYLSKRRMRFKGFTLVEAVITVVFFSLIVGACFLLSKVGNDSWQINSVRVEIAQENRKAIDWLMNELRQSGAATIAGVPADGNWYTAITFKISSGVSSGAVSWSDPIEYSIGGAGHNQLIRTQSGQTRVIASDLGDFQVRRLAATPKIVEVALTFNKRTSRANQTLDLNSNFKIKMRND